MSLLQIPQDVTASLWADIIPGEALEMQIDVDRPLSAGELSCIQSQLESEPIVLLAPITQDKSNTLHIRFRNPETEGVGIWPLWAIIGLVAAIPVGIIAWRLFTVDPMEWVPFLTIVGMLGLGGYIIYKAITK